MTRPFGYFVHHQGRGHAERFAAIAHALPPGRPLVAFCARDDVFPALPAQVELIRIPSLFERSGQEAPGMDGLSTPDTVHCAPVGWPGIRRAMATMAAWFERADPALMICDVSAEVAQLARLCSVPHVKVLQHGDRSDPGHRAAYDGAVGLLAPFHRSLAQPDWDQGLMAKTVFAGGLGVEATLPDRAQARARIGLSDDTTMHLVLSGGGGGGFGQAALGVGARATPDVRWITIGPVERDWHATEPGNLEHRGWVANPADYVAAADLVIASTGNTTCQMILNGRKPWLAVPEWRYFDEQVKKAQALARAGLATVRPHLPSSAHDWRAALAQTRADHDPATQAACVDPDPAGATARWLCDLADRLWAGAPSASSSSSIPAKTQHV